MSGICAVWLKDRPRAVRHTLAQVASGLSIGNDETVQQHSDENVGVAVSARFATQQVYSTPRLLIACDAKLYNEEEFQCRGAREESPGKASTAAIIAVLYERFGSDFIEKLRGNISVIIWDRLEKKLFAAVDKFGINRLVYYNDDKVFLVTSRIDAIVRSGHIDAKVNPRSVASVLNFSAVSGPETILANVHRLSPGNRLIASERQIRIEKYWDMQYGNADGGSEVLLSRELEKVVEASVTAHCNAFQEIGAFLSGGTDSSTVVGMMTRAKKAPVKAFSIGFQEQSFDELEYAEIAAKKFHADHYKYLVGPDDCFAALPQMIRCFDEPFGNSSAIPTYFCARLAAQNGVKTLLAGDGGDELFGGNEHYLVETIFDVYHRIPPFLRNGLIEPILKVLPTKAGLVRRAKGYVRRAKMPGVERTMSFQFLLTHRPEEVFESDFLETCSGFSILEVPSRYYLQAPARAHLDRLLYLDVKMTLGDSDLPKVTCMCELAGVQASFPFLDPDVAAFSGSIPPHLKVKGFQKRYLFKRAFRDLLPAEVINKKKHGFGIPVATWLKTDPRMRELSQDTLFSRRAFERGYFRRGFIEELFRKHTDDTSSYYGDAIWSFLVLELWHRQFVDAPTEVMV